jgi:hypothetical protein
MYLLQLRLENHCGGSPASLTIDKDRGRIRKWTVLSAGRLNRDLIRLIALACGGPSIVSRLHYPLGRFSRRQDDPLHLECLLARHSPGDCPKGSASVRVSGIRINRFGSVTALGKKERRLFPASIPFGKLRLGTGNTAFFFVAYGQDPVPLKKDRFDFIDPFFRITRFHSLFIQNAPITDPAAFLTRLHYRGIQKGRFPAKKTMKALCDGFGELLGIDTVSWLQETCDFKTEWEKLRPWQQRAVLPIMDAARHMLDAFPRSGEPLKAPALMLLDRPDRFSTEKGFSRWLTLVDALFPSAQFLITLPDKTRSQLPSRIKRMRLLLPDAGEGTSTGAPVRLPRGAVLLLDVDSRLPNLALMKLSRHFREEGRPVVLARKDAMVKGVESVYASCVYSIPSSQVRLEKLREHYGQSLVVGGSGADVRMRLPAQIEDLPADYSLYPELGDRAIGFLTRGCPFRCPFCIVPVKEGKPRQVSDLDTLLENGRRRKIILLDDNILSHPMADDFLQEMVSRAVQVNFTQTLDLRLLNRERAKLLRRVHASNTLFTRRNYHFSLNNARNLEQMGRKYRMMGFSSRDNVEFICMYGYDTTLEEDVERFRFLRSLPGAYVFVQEYQPILGGPEPDLSSFFDARADQLIDDLIRILFPQNMKSMEKYYRWLSRQYFLSFGRPHRRLVDTIFRYNARDRKGFYLAKLERLAGH